MLKAALLGTGYGAEVYARALNVSTLVEATTVVSRDISAAKQVKSAFGFKHASDALIEVIDDKDIDLLLVATPPHTHFDILKQALLNQKHVIVAAPFVTSLKDAEYLSTLSIEQQRVAVVDYHLNYVPARRYAAKLIKEGKIGDVRLVQRHLRNGSRFTKSAEPMWKYRSDAFGGMLALYGSHDVDYFLRIFGGINEVKVQSKTIETERFLSNNEAMTCTSDDQYVMELKFHTGTIAQCIVNGFHPGRELNEFVFYGSKGTLVVNDDNELILYEPDQDRQRISIPPNFQLNAITGPRACSTFYALLDSVLGSIYHHTPVSPTFDEALHTQRVIQAAMKSNANVSWQNLELEPNQQVAVSQTAQSVNKIYTS